MERISAIKHTETYQPPIGAPCWHTVRDAARATGLSERAIRRACRLAGVTRVSGRTVRGMVELYADGRAGWMPYSQ